MGLLDKLRGRKAEAEPTKNENRDDLPTAAEASGEIERAIAKRCAEVDYSKCRHIPFEDIAVLGAAFAQCSGLFRTVTVQGTGYIPVNLSDMDRMKLAKDGHFWGAAFTDGGKSKFLKWQPEGPTKVKLPVDPTMVLMVVMLATIEKKLDAIQETQTKILSFLENDKQAEQEGNLKVLSDMLSGYKFNWDNAQFLQNNHMKVLDIKQTSEKNIIFYQKQIAADIQKIPAVYVDKIINTTASEIAKHFAGYRMALYLFAFSSFLEVMLLGNFQQEYLDQTAERVHQYNDCYQKQRSQCSEMLGKLASASVETKVLWGIGNATRSLGKLISATPVLGRGNVDEWMEENGEKLLKNTGEKAKKLKMRFSENETIGNECFEDSIRCVGTILNQTKEIFIKDDSLYLA